MTAILLQHHCLLSYQCWYLLFRERQRVSYVPIIIRICAMITVDAEKNDSEAASQGQT